MCRQSRAMIILREGPPPDRNRGAPTDGLDGGFPYRGNFYPSPVSDPFWDTPGLTISKSYMSGSACFYFSVWYMCQPVSSTGTPSGDWVPLYDMVWSYTVTFEWDDGAALPKITCSIPDVHNFSPATVFPSWKVVVPSGVGPKWVPFP